MNTLKLFLDNLRLIVPATCASMEKAIQVILTYAVPDLSAIILSKIKTLHKEEISDAVIKTILYDYFNGRTIQQSIEPQPKENLFTEMVDSNEGKAQFRRRFNRASSVTSNQEELDPNERLLEELVSQK
jgi:hypothetical protein